MWQHHNWAHRHGLERLRSRQGGWERQGRTRAVLYSPASAHIRVVTRRLLSSARVDTQARAFDILLNLAACSSAPSKKAQVLSGSLLTEY